MKAGISNSLPGVSSVKLMVALLMGGLCCEGGAHDEADDTSGKNTGLGYLTAPSLSPGHILRPSSIFVMPVLGSKGAERLDADLHWANVWNYKPGQYMIDGEWIISNLRYSYGWDDDVSFGFTVPVVGRAGGFADSTIENFHSAFHLGNAQRDEFPRNRSLITVNNQGSPYTVAEGDSWGIGDVSAFVAGRITEGTSVLPAVTVQGEIFLPTGNEDELRGMGAPAIALSSVASKRLWGSPFVAFLGMGFEYCNSDNISIIEIRDEQFSGLAGMEYQYSKSLSLIAQYLLSTAVAKHYFAFSKPSHEVGAGFKWRVGPDSALELAVVENVGVFKNSADIGIHLAFGWNL